jgi:hypothetical protein
MIVAPRSGWPEWVKTDKIYITDNMVSNPQQQWRDDSTVLLLSTWVPSVLICQRPPPYPGGGTGQSPILFEPTGWGLCVCRRDVSAVISVRQLLPFPPACSTRA